MEVSQKVKDKLEEVVSLWAEENLEGKPAILGYAVYSSMLQLLEAKTTEVADTFK